MVKGNIKILLTIHITIKNNVYSAAAVALAITLHLASCDSSYGSQRGQSFGSQSNPRPVVGTNGRGSFGNRSPSVAGSANKLATAGKNNFGFGGLGSASSSSFSSAGARSSAGTQNQYGNGNQQQGNSYGPTEEELELKSLADSLPGGGVPGEDFPVLSEIPETNFQCNDQSVSGYYADSEAGCQLFHICQIRGSGRVQQDSFLCPNGTIFNQRYFVCDWWFNFDCATAQNLFVLNEQIGEAGLEFGEQNLASNNNYQNFGQGTGGHGSVNNRQNIGHRTGSSSQGSANNGQSSGFNSPPHAFGQGSRSAGFGNQQFGAASVRMPQFSQFGSGNQQGAQQSQFGSHNGLGLQYSAPSTSYGIPSA